MASCRTFSRVLARLESGELPRLPPEMSLWLRGNRGVGGHIIRRSRRLQFHPLRYYHSSPAALGLHRKQLATLEGAREFLSALPPAQRSNLNSALENIRNSEEAKEVGEPSWKQLRLLCYQNTLPFIGFGFLDNFIMITVADRIEDSIGVILCLSTMAAAGMGNMVSDLAGLGLADQVDSLCRALGIPDPKLTPGQLRHRASRWMSLLGRCAGVIIGCVIGMCPLLWIHGRGQTTPTNSDSDQKSEK